jgi:septal ring factor EnvC (AmiA/AmiB activator)
MRQLHEQIKSSACRFLKSKVALLQTELEAGKSLNDTLEKENAKHAKKIKKLALQADKTTGKITSLESTLKATQESFESAERGLKVMNEL